MHDLLMARQPIFDQHKQLFGYELLFRSEDNKTARQVGGDIATGQVIVNLCTSIREQFEVLRQPLFINITGEFLRSEVFLPLESEMVVLELLETTEINADILSAVESWRSKGFRFALDDYSFEERFQPLLPLLDFLKVDLLMQSLEQTIAGLAHLQTYSFKLIAEKVEDMPAYKACLEAGFDYFQGNFLAYPHKIYGKVVAPNFYGLINVLAQIQSPDTNVEQLSRAVSSEPRLVYQLLRILNSPACPVQRKIKNVKEAIIYLGLAQLKKWTLLILFSASRKLELELVRILLVRARACERYAEILKLPDPENFFMTGLLSGVDQLLGTEKSVVFKHINLADHICSAILKFEGAAGEALAHTMEMEQSHWNRLSAMPEQNFKALFTAFDEAGLWAHETLAMLN
jgi:c-di-GMP phosphodiesterase